MNEQEKSGFMPEHENRIKELEEKVKALMWLHGNNEKPQIDGLPDDKLRPSHFSFFEDYPVK